MTRFLARHISIASCAVDAASDVGEGEAARPEAAIWDEGQGVRMLVGYRRLELDGTVSFHWLIDPNRLTGVIVPEAFAHEEVEQQD